MARVLAFSATTFRIFPADARLLPAPTREQHRQRPLRSVASPPQSLLPSRPGTGRSHLSILHACRRKAPSSSHLISSAHRRFVKREPCPRIFRRRIAESLFASSPRRREFPSTIPARFRRFFPSPIFPPRAFAPA